MARKFSPGHYCDVAQSQRETFSKTLERVNHYLSPPEISGVKFQIRWKDVEPSKGRYVFDTIDAVVAIAASRKKRVVIEVKDRLFGAHGCRYINKVLPLYIIEEKFYYVSAKVGGVEGKCMPKVFNAAYMDRWIALMSALYARYEKDPSVVMIQCLNETALGKPVDASFNFTFQQYTDQLVRMLAELPQGKTRFMLSINYLGGSDTVYTRRLIAECVKRGVAISWPDALLGEKPHGAKKWSMTNPGKAVIAPDADSTLMRYDPKTKTGDVPEVLRHYVDDCGANYIFWQPVFSGRYAPKDRRGLSTYFEDHIVHSIRAVSGKINKTEPVV